MQNWLKLVQPVLHFWLFQFFTTMFKFLVIHLLLKFIIEIEKWIPVVTRCRLHKQIIQNLGYLYILLH